jgi:hypothetical protein
MGRQESIRLIGDGAVTWPLAVSVINIRLVDDSSVR